MGRKKQTDKQAAITDNQYIERLEYCQYPMNCCICKYRNDCFLDNEKTVDLIHRQKAEIERLGKVETELQELNAKYYNEAKDLRRENKRLTKENAELQKLVNFLINKETPKKVKCCINLPKDRIAGYCPSCMGTVDIRLTWLVQHKGHRCSWCGQKIDLSGVEKKEVGDKWQKKNVTAWRQNDENTREI